MVHQSGKIKTQIRTRRTTTDELKAGSQFSILMFSASVSSGVTDSRNLTSFPGKQRDLFCNPNIDCPLGFKCESKKCLPNFEQLYGPNPLIGAAGDGNINVVKELISDPQIDVNQEDENKDYPLYLAASNGHLEVVKELLAHPQINVNQGHNFDEKPDKNPVIPRTLVQLFELFGKTPLHAASLKGHVAVVKELLAQPNIHVNHRFPCKSPLYAASHNGHVGVARELLALPQIDVNIYVFPCGSPLYDASGEGHVEVVKELLAHPQINVNQFYPAREETPLYFAARKGNAEVVKELIAHPQIDVNEGGWDRRPPLYAASFGGHVAVVKELLTHPQIKVNKVDGSYSRTPFIVASQNGHVEVVRMLLAHPEINVNHRCYCFGKGGRTALQRASQTGEAEVVKELLADPRVDPNISPRGPRDKYYPALNIAVRMGYLEVVKLLLRCPKVIVGIKDKEGNIQPDVSPSSLSLEDHARELGHLDIVKAIESRQTLLQLGHTC